MPLNDVRPEYPRYALQRGIQGHVKLAFTITRAGKVENVRVLEAEPANVFEREARRAAVRWHEKTSQRPRSNSLRSAAWVCTAALS